MGTPHNNANVGDIAEKILLPGDPWRLDLFQAGPELQVCPI